MSAWLRLFVMALALTSAAACDDKPAPAPTAPAPTAPPAAAAASAPAAGGSATRTPCEQGRADACPAECQAGSGWACSLQARGMVRDKSGDVDAWAKLHVRACQLGDGEGCLLASAHHETGQALPKDETKAAQLLQKAVELFEKECDAQRGFSCQRLAGLYLKGRGVASDRKKAVSLYRKACDLGLTLACMNVKRFDSDATSK